MISRFSALLATFIILLGFSAQASEIFTVPKVSVYSEAENAAAAQAKAQAIGRRRAMDLLLRRLTAEEDWVYLPNLAAGRPASAQVPTPTIEDEFGFETYEGIVQMNVKTPISLESSDLTAMEEGFSIFDEKTSPTTYRAKITYRFKPEAIRNLLQDAGLPYSEAQARRALVVPVLETPNGVYLWETKNPWARAWLDRPLQNELTPLILPVGDRQDIETITADGAVDLDPVGLSQLAARYNVNQVILAWGKVQDIDDEYQLLVRLIDAYYGDRASTNAAANAAAARYDSDTGYGASAVETESSSESGRVVAETFFRGPNDDFPQLAQRAVETTVARYAKDWKSKTLVDHASIRPLRLTAWFVGLDEWGRIQRALEGTPLVRGMKVGAMNKENAVIDLELLGDNDQLILAMRQADLAVWQAADGTWNISDNARAAELQIELNDIAFSRRDDMDRMNTPSYDRATTEYGAEDPSLFLPDDFGDDLFDPNAPQDPGAPVMLDAPVALEPLTPDADTDEDE